MFSLMSSKWTLTPKRIQNMMEIDSKTQTYVPLKLSNKKIKLELIT